MQPLSRRSNLLIAPALLLVFSATVTAQVDVPPARPANPPQQGGKYIVMFRPGTGLPARAASVARAGALLRHNYRIIEAAAVNVPNVNVLAALRSDMSVLDIVADRPIYASQALRPLKKPGGGAGATQVVPAGVTRVGLPGAGSDGTGIGVLVADTGIDLDHPDLAANLDPVNKYDAFGGDCNDGGGHGTHVAGIIAAADNTIDVIGVAPRARLYCGKALDNKGSGTDSSLIAVLDWVYSNWNVVSPNIRVVNMSLGRDKAPGDDTGPLRQAIQALYALQIVVVVSAGNDPAQEVKETVPAGFPEVLAVASTTAKAGTNSCRSFSGAIAADTASYFTTDGKLDSITNIGVTISGPGEDQENISRACFLSPVGILSLQAGGGTTRMSGTSMAAPHVSGVVARILQKGYAGTVEAVRAYLRANADRAGSAPLNSPTSSYTYDGEREGIVKAP